MTFLVTRIISLFSDANKVVKTRNKGAKSNGVFERRTSTGSEVFFILKHLDDTKFLSACLYSRLWRRFV